MRSRSQENRLEKGNVLSLLGQGCDCSGQVQVLEAGTAEEREEDHKPVP